MASVRRQTAFRGRPSWPDSANNADMATSLGSHGHYAVRRGFTLIELLIAVVIVSLLATLALPSFLDAVRKSRRSEAFAALAAVQQAQERWRANSANYTTTLSDLRPTIPATTNSGYYTVSLAPPPVAHAPGLATGYVATAIAVAGTSQAADAQCAKLSLRALDGNIQYAGCGSCGSFTYASAHPCWSQ